jgi:hypothetical protein
MIIEFIPPGFRLRRLSSHGKVCPATAIATMRSAGISDIGGKVGPL